MGRNEWHLLGSVGERCLVHHRKLDIGLLEHRSDALRWHVAANAIFALMTDPITNMQCGVHRTFLKADGSKRARRMLGPQGVIRLSADDDVTLGLGLVEGVEDGMALLSCGWHPVWVANCSDPELLRSSPFYVELKTLTIFADADVAGLRAARACAVRWRYAGRSAYFLPPESYEAMDQLKDWDELLRENPNKRSAICAIDSAVAGGSFSDRGGNGKDPPSGHWLSRCILRKKRT